MSNSSVGSSVVLDPTNFLCMYKTLKHASEYIFYSTDEFLLEQNEYG